ncbi:MAG: mannonate dehydratase [Clostridia bacterium]|nr:mannonate dehydratase [Clostridia bacterium]
MKMTFRWYGPSDPVTLEQIRQIPGMSGIVTAVYDVPPGEVWPRASIRALVDAAHAQGLEAEVIESVPVHEDIKLGRGDCDRYIRNYAENVRRLGEAGVRCICYNFMPVFDWLRTDLHTRAEDGSYSLSYQPEAMAALDPRRLSLPGWDESYTPDALSALLDAYAGMTHERLFLNWARFLEGVLPACGEAGVSLAVHPDDPPWDVFGLPRIVSRRADYERLFDAFPDRRCGVTFCTGSLGASADNDLPAMARDFAAAGRVHFAHLRNIERGADGRFREVAHLSSAGSLDLYAIVRALVDGGFDGYVRPDHGRHIWGEEGKPGYGLYDRALGAAYLNGLFEACERR